jgi:hypothetical protein
MSKTEQAIKKAINAKDHAHGCMFALLAVAVAIQDVANVQRETLKEARRILRKKP